MAVTPPAERPALISWEILEGGEILATFALADGRRCQLLVADQQLTAGQVAEMAAAAGLLAPRPSQAMLDVS